MRSWKLCIKTADGINVAAEFGLRQQGRRPSPASFAPACIQGVIVWTALRQPEEYSAHNCRENHTTMTGLAGNVKSLRGG